MGSNRNDVYICLVQSSRLYGGILGTVKGSKTTVNGNEMTQQMLYCFCTFTV